MPHLSCLSSVLWLIAPDPTRACSILPTGTLPPGEWIMSRSWGHTLIAVALLSVPCVYVARIGVADYDLWWHLRTADWILDHHTFPIGDPYSPYDDAGPWTAYSWLFEFGARAAYQAGGLT